MILLIGVLLLTCIYWIRWMVKLRHVDKLTASLPMPPSKPLIGHSALFLGNNQQIYKNLWTIAELALKHKHSAKVWLGPKLYVAIADPADAQVVLENCLDKDMVYRFLRPWLGHGLFVAPVNLWKSHRRVLLPVFQNKVVKEYLEVISEQIDVLLQRLNEQTDKEEFDILKYVTACTLDIVFQTAMGERMDVQNSPDTPYLRARHTVMTILNLRLFKVWLQPDWIFNLTRYAKLQKDNIDLTHKFTDEIVRKRRQEYQNNLTKKHQDNKFHAVLDLLFKQEIDFTDEQLREHIDSITIAGNDTTALVIAYTLVLLGIHQDAQEKVLEEQRSIFGTSTCGANKWNLQKMHYLERVIKESMRLYTVVPIIARNVDKDIYLPTCGVTVPAGSGAVIGAFALHRSESSWGPEPHKFDPDRFLPEKSVNRHPAAFMPFSYGSRNCIGGKRAAKFLNGMLDQTSSETAYKLIYVTTTEVSRTVEPNPLFLTDFKKGGGSMFHCRKFGMLIMKSIISSVVRTYKLNADDIGDLKVEMLLFPIKGHQVKISRRLNV